MDTGILFPVSNGMNEEFLKNIHTAHFVGIGGIGVSALARIMLLKGAYVTGSDRERSIIIEKLEEDGAKIFIGHNATNVPENCDLVVYSPAIAMDNPELVVASESGAKVFSYPRVLGILSEGMRTIAVSGTHGKTTTTAMISEILVGAKLSPTVVVGSLLKKTGTNFILGTSNLFVVEACEYQRSFINLSPDILAITNIDNDHLDYYGTIEGVQKAFAEFVEKVPANGAIVCDPNDPFVAPVLVNATARIVDYTKENIIVPLQITGDHNKKNAKVAIAIAKILGVDGIEATRLLALFGGTWRRMELKGKIKNGALVYDDYAHHPTEIKATLQGFRAKYFKWRLVVVYQPHLYSRTKTLLNDFAQSFGDADEVIVAPIYAAREAPDPEISSEVLAEAIRAHNPNVHVGSNFSEIENYLRDTITPNDVIITMGAGDIYKVGESLLG
ncbi:MAG: UDP-N-acetylmuramate--L-alanine ligase [Candidatus Yonathbacteria bacterium CG10_big_fil_rev_8_21_14_0_10_43_136]|nr:MAG: UDP-N-acetylmuramate--L-alanine ligase [Candidatus Yonathbacteria bacterium CG17_big_fil_post_rev_8_21_14_2_50_43_9]PIR40723.1 MAG: UDP-N-acetylmuramate--L-alanine ligase [Candidatus Yonathbacteria bacterium CG10_big_fil_rev_8_21_14_0_10_43_136]PIX56990.1 MAG: UDP-N-acetylmuramate--L-alanine ligase [Candidatus Yonathbacteria bacterium CG_4_10_14_3_um_filter_43_12]